MEKEPKKQRPEENGAGEERPEGARQRAINPWVLIIGLLVLVVVWLGFRGDTPSRITWTQFEQYVDRGDVKDVEFVAKTHAKGTFTKKDDKLPAQLEFNHETQKWEEKKNDKGEVIRLRENFRVNLPNVDDQVVRMADKLRADKIPLTYSDDSDNALFFFYAVMILLPLGVLVLMWVMMRRTRDQMMGGGFLSGFSRSTARKFQADKKHSTFDDVAGLDNVKADLQEIIEFLKSPEKFQRLGGQVPKGVLLLGPPGTGKTLLARAVAGEAGVPFFSVNGSEFIQMFVGVGASRVRDLFQTAKRSAPAIVFIDEIDAVGRQRGAGLGGGHDEREQTLNQILSEMDGFTQGETVIVVAATNRPDVLDPALLRPGRFDRHVTVDRPTRKGREAIFKVHVRDVPLDADVDLERLAAGTVGLTGADIRNIVNESALWAARQNKSKVSMDDFEYARDKLLMGPRREDALMGEEKERTAYHEAGHALLAWLLAGVDRVHKVTVIPRGRTLGVTQMLPEEDKLNVSENELHNRLSCLLGGREAERIVYQQCSVGAENDLERATSIARSMVTRWGMSKRLGPVSYKLSNEDPFLGREMHAQRHFSEHTMQIIDEEVARILHTASEQARSVLEKNRDKLDAMAAALVEKEELGDAEITELIGPSIHVQNASDSNGAPQSASTKSSASGDGKEKASS